MSTRFTWEATSLVRHLVKLSGRSAPEAPTCRLFGFLGTPGIRLKLHAPADGAKLMTAIAEHHGCNLFSPYPHEVAEASGIGGGVTLTSGLEYHAPAIHPYWETFLNTPLTPPDQAHLVGLLSSTPPSATSRNARLLSCSTVAVMKPHLARLPPGHAEDQGEKGIRILRRHLRRWRRILDDRRAGGNDQVKPCCAKLLRGL